MNTPKEYETLKALAALDRRRRELAAAAAALPEGIAQREAGLAARREDFGKHMAALETAQKERRRLEAVVTDKNQMLVKYRQQLGVVKTNKEYQSLQHEIESTRKEVLQAEDRLLETLECQEREQIGIAARRSELAAWEAEAERANATDREKLKDVELQLFEVEEKRKRLVPELSAQLRSEYLRLYDRYKTDAFAVAKEGYCQGCFVNIPAQILSELHAGGRLYRCESCGRFVIFIEEEWTP